MPTRVHFVAAIGRNSLGSISAIPRIESICAKHGGKVVGGLGNSTDPIAAEFTEKVQAVAAAQEAFFLDDVESAKVMGADANAAGGVNEGAETEKEIVVEDVDSAIAAVVAGKTAKEVVAAMIEAKVKAKALTPVVDAAAK